MHVTDEGLARLERAIMTQTLKDTYGISDAAYELLRVKLERLVTATPSAFGITADRATDDELDPVEAGLRTSARTLAAVLSPSSEDPALWMARSVPNPAMDLRHWQEVLAPRARELPVHELRDIARTLRRGLSIPRTMEVTGHSKRQVERVSHLLGIADWRRQRELSVACEHLEQGLSARESWHAYLDAVDSEDERPGLKTWRRRVSEAQAIVWGRR